jgi:hypothetical protein
LLSLGGAVQGSERLDRQAAADDFSGVLPERFRLMVIPQLSVLC